MNTIMFSKQYDLINCMLNIDANDNYPSAIASTYLRFVSM